MANPASLPPAEGGFSLVELVATLSIIGIVTSMAFPSFSGLLANSELTGGINQFVAQVQYARSESIKRGYDIIMCPSQDQQSCTGGFDWSNGFILFADPDHNRQPDSNQDVLTVNSELAQQLQVLSSSGRKKLKFKATGMSPGSNATVRFCHHGNAAPAKAVIISNTGRPRVSTTLPGGGQITCP